jgi:hypothetical protein
MRGLSVCPRKLLASARYRDSDLVLWHIATDRILVAESRFRGKADTDRASLNSTATKEGSSDAPGMAITSCY